MIGTSTRTLFIIHQRRWGSDLNAASVGSGLVHSSRQGRVIRRLRPGPVLKALWSPLRLLSSVSCTECVRDALRLPDMPSVMGGIHAQAGPKVVSHVTGERGLDRNPV